MQKPEITEDVNGEMPLPTPVETSVLLIGPTAAGHGFLSEP